MSGKKPQELAEQPPLPKAFEYLWSWYCELHTGNPISFAEIESWSRLTRKQITSFEVEVMRELYGVFLEVQNGRSQSSSN